MIYHGESDGSANVPIGKIERGFVGMAIISNAEQRSDFSAPTLLEDINGIGITELAGIIGFNRVPPDHNGAVGVDHVVSVLNHVMQIYDKNGNILSTQPLESLFGVVDVPFVLPVDPNILYDPHSGRFVFVSFEVAGGSNGAINAADDVSQLNIAVSKTGNPLDGWHVTSIDAKTFINGQNSWVDFPGVGVDGDAIYITGNMFQFDAGPDGTRTFEGNRVWIIDKGEGGGGLYDGGALSFSVHDPVAEADDPMGFGVSEATMIPARIEGVLPDQSGMFLMTQSGLTSANGVDEIMQIIHVEDPLGSPTFTAQSVNLGDISDETLTRLPDAPQQGAPQSISVVGGRVLTGGTVYRDGKIYTAFTVAPKTGPDAGESTVHWVELDASNPTDISLIQQGDIGGEDIAQGTTTFDPSINVNKDGSVLINYSASGPSIFAGAYYALRAPDDPLGQFGPSQVLHEGLDSYFRTRAGEGISSQTINRWGDFSGVSIDPADETTFWFFNQFADTSGSPNAAGQDGRWRVTIGSARATVKNFQFSAGDDDEDYYGGLGTDGLVIHALGINSALDVSVGSNSSTRLQVNSGADGLINAHSVETIIFQRGVDNDALSITGGLPIIGPADRSFRIFGGDGNDTLSGETFTTPYLLVLDGGAHNDRLIGSPGDDRLSGGADEDTLFGNVGNDTLLGDDGDDSLSGDDGNDKLFGHGGRDMLSGDAGDDKLVGGGDNDRLVGGEGNDSLFGGANSDTLKGQSGGDLIEGEGGNDDLFGGGGGDTLKGGLSNDMLMGEDGRDVLDGGDGADTLDGGAGNDTLFTGDGDNFASGGDNNDIIVGGDGRDTIYGDAGHDKLFGGGEKDRLFGGVGNDSLFGNANADILNGETGDDEFRGFGGNDRLSGGAGSDGLLGHTGNDIINGGDDGDILDAGEGADQLFGEGGNDVLFGRDGNDVMDGGVGDDDMFGGKGADRMTGGTGADTLAGNGGNDRFVFALGDGADVISDFVVGAGSLDFIDLSGMGAAFDTFAEVQSVASDDGFGNTLIDFGGGDTITLTGVAAASLHQDDFVF